MSVLRIVNVVGARPNFMKIAPIVSAIEQRTDMESILVHTGQHYDHVMSDLFFNQLGLPRPDIYLGVGSGSHGEQTGKIMIEFEQVLQDVQPDLVLVVGDVNSTIACGLVAVKMGIKLAHVEAGLRSFDRTMPEEINRVLTDQISDYLFITERSAFENLMNEGIAENKIHFVGNVMIDTLLRHRENAASSAVLDELGLEPRQFILVTLHRPANVDDPRILEKLLQVLGMLSRDMPVVFPVHPRTRKQVQQFGFEELVRQYPGLRLIEPLGYLDFLKCMDNAKFVLTDSGGIQEETTVLGVPCITARDNTERPVTVTQGTNVVVGRNPERILQEARKILQGNWKRGQIPELWDGKAAERIVDILTEKEGVKLA
ncbi:MAG: UDP-N-acetylglucosamine 2-epimerase (non-hydrolyzing) [candidate division KSB1 bacterium]|nr:UDP-N-acetylglucosamine 2-epimerase (non-hydrolyzing) [candidate division KSB1 bacterium]